MAALELDPMFRRGLRLLHSRNRDSVDQLKLLLDEAVRQRQGKPPNKVGHYAPPNAKDPFALRRESPTPIPRPRQSSPIPLSLKRDDHKKDKSRDEDMVAAKRPRLESPMGFKSHTPSPTPSLKSESSSRSRKSDESDSDEMNDLAMEIMDGINCNVCKSFDVSSRNQLVECQECHALYHQECHKPPVTDQDVNDPRLVWYCAKCTKTMKKQGGLVSSNASSGGTVTRGGSHSSNLQGVTSAVSGSSTRSSSSALPTRPTSSPTKGLGLSRPSPFANLASATSGRSLGVSSASSSSIKGGLGSSSSSNSSSNAANNSGKSSGPSNSMLSAERRMHMMKKKAAAKMAEKRKL